MFFKGIHLFPLLGSAIDYLATLNVRPLSCDFFVFSFSNQNAACPEELRGLAGHCAKCGKTEMKVTYDKYYETENLFGNPYPELIEFFEEYSKKGKVLDLGCGQGRDSIPLARLGYEVTGIDNSKVGIEQMNRIAETESLALTGKVIDIFEFDNFEEYDFILLDSMFHFTKNGQKKETDFIKRILSKIKKACLVIFCVQDTGKKIEILNETIDFKKQLNRLIDKKFEYIFDDKENGHKSKTDYRMLVVEK